MTTTEIIRKNMWPSPWFSTLPRYDADTCTAYVGDDPKYGHVLRISTVSEGASFVDYAFGGLVPGASYVLSAVCYIPRGEGGYMGSVPLQVCSYDGLTFLASANSGEGEFASEARFAAPDDGGVMVKIRCPAKVGITSSVCNPQLELASTYDAAVSGGGSGSSPGIPCRDHRCHVRAGGAR